MIKIYVRNINDYVIVDDMFAWLNKYSWYRSNRGYIVRQLHINKGHKQYLRKTIMLHSIITETQSNITGVWLKPGYVTDHINHNKLDNQLHNLRVVTPRENFCNKYNNTSGTTGVHWHKTSKKWCAQIKINYKRKHLGLYSDKQDAIVARKEAEKILFSSPMFSYRTT